jgi:hypothetical protein
VDSESQVEHAGPSHDEPLLEVQRAFNAVHWLYSLGSEWTPDECREVLDRMSPFLDRPNLDGSKSRTVSNNLLMLIWSAVGDAHLELGQIAASADAYRHACEFRPSCAYGDFYADITLKHNLSEHYQPALRSLEVGVEEWAKYGRELRVFAQFWSFCRAPWGYVRHIKHVYRRKQRIRELHRRIANLVPG